jgi:2-keto-4-pentenoate hydratase/2-oxohepta-3-ene-1,7-dioic acid hydratase in catechol pathway
MTPAVSLAEPEFFLKVGQTRTAPSAPCVYPRAVTGKLAYETELGVVIGRAAHDVRPEAALDFVAGYVVLNDLTARDRQVARSPNGGLSYALGPAKNFDGSARIGAFFETADATGDPQGLELSTSVSGELRQLNTAAMIFSVAELIPAAHAPARCGHLHRHSRRHWLGNGCRTRRDRAHAAWLHPGTVPPAG